MTTLNVLYRGPLASCNYGCTYCPFAKRQESLADLEPDRHGLSAFQHWIECSADVRFRVLFTPWGEALIRPWYQSAIISLSHVPHLDRVGIQTNLSCNLDWVPNCNLDIVTFWATYHPTETDRARFVNKVRFLHDLGVRLSVGVVGLKEHFEKIERLRGELPPEVYLWVNAYKRVPDYYTPEDLEFLTDVDRLFPLNTHHYPSHNEPCAAGETSITVDGEGLIRRCHFIPEPIGSIHDAHWRTCLQPQLCPNATCGCYIGYVNLNRLKLEDHYGTGVYDRIPLGKST